MKYTALSISIFFCYFSHAADSDTTKVKKKKIQQEVFVNTTFFIKQIINLSNTTTLAVSPYIVGYKCFFDQNNGIRFSAGGGFTNQKNFSDTTSVNITTSGTVNLRLGYEYRRNLGKHWTFFTGMDVLTDWTWTYARDNSDVDIVTTKTTTWDFGGGPLIGIQVNIGKRVALFTETAFYYLYGKTKNYVNSVNLPELDQNQVASVNQSGQFLLPTSVYFVFKF